MAQDAESTIRESLPPTTDYITYLTILEYHLSPTILPTLNELLQDVDLVQNIGWDLIHLLIPLSGSEACLQTIAKLGNPREVILKITESLQLLDLDDVEQEDEDIGVDPAKSEDNAPEPSKTHKFCVLVGLLAIVHARIKTRYPSRFLSTSLMAVLSSYRPSNEATLTVISFIRTISGQKRPPLPGRISSSILLSAMNDGPSLASALPDPEAQEEDPNESVIQRKLLQSFITHILECYINQNTLEWSGRLLQLYQPEKVLTVTGDSILAEKKSLADSYRDDPELLERDAIVGQLLALTGDMGLSDYSELLSSIFAENPGTPEIDGEENYPSTPGAIPLSAGGSLFIITSLVFSAVSFSTNKSLPSISIFPDHANLFARFLPLASLESFGAQEPGVTDAILALGIWLEHGNKFVSGPLEDEEFLNHLRALSLISANDPSPSLRYSAHSLTSSLLHAHPQDRLRLSFISDTLEYCPIETLKASAVGWLKEEIITANTRITENVFSSTTALAAAQPYLFPDISALAGANDSELVEELSESFPFHMAVVNFLYFIASDNFKHLVPSAMFGVAEQIYVGPLAGAVKKVQEVLTASPNADELGQDSNALLLEFQLLENRIELAAAQMN